MHILRKLDALYSVEFCVYSIEKKYLQTIALFSDSRRRSLTRLELHFADHQPLAVEAELEFDEASDAVLEGDDCEASAVEQLVPRVIEAHRRLVVVAMAGDAETHRRCPEHAHVLVERVAAVQTHLGEVTHRVKAEHEGERAAGDGFVAPPDPLVPAGARPRAPGPAVVPQPLLALVAVRQLAQAARQTAGGDVAIVCRVVEVDVDAAPVTLLDVVRDDAVWRKETREGGEGKRERREETREGGEGRGRGGKRKREGMGDEGRAGGDGRWGGIGCDGNEVDGNWTGRKARNRI